MTDAADLLLVIDVGNTNTVLGLYRDEELVEHWRINTNPQRTTDELGIVYRSLFATRDIPTSAVSAAICATVVPPMVHANRRACRRYFGVEPVFIGELDLRLDVHYSLPRDVGADRLVNAIAAYERHKTACIIVDFGTATTFDVVGPDGSYRGGVIAPGLGISLEALHQRASKLPRVEIKRPDKAIGTSTVTSMQSGIVYGYVGLVDGICERIDEELRTDLGAGEVTVLGTGGLAGLIGGESRFIERVEPFLTLDGLRICFDRSR